MNNALQPSQQLALRIGRKNRVVAVTSIREASQMWCRFRDEEFLGASDSPPVTVVDVDSGKTVARISYNGRAWASDGAEISM